MGQAKQRGTYAERVAQAKAKQVETPYGTKTDFGNGYSITNISDMNGWIDSMREQAAQDAQILLDKYCSPSNVDFSIFSDPALVTKQLTIGGRKMTVHLHTDAEKLKPMADRYNQTFKALFQIFTKKGSALFPITAEQIADAGHDYKNDEVLAPDDVLNRAVAALRLNYQSMTLHSIAKHIAYEETSPDSGKEYYEGIKGSKLYQVWD